MAATAHTGLAAESATDPYRSFKLGAQSYCFREFSLEQAVPMLKSLGLSRFEIFPGHLPWDSKPEDIQKAKAMLEKAGVTVPSYGVEHFTADEARSRKIFEFAKSMGITMLSADPDPDSFPSLDKLTQEFDITIGIHNHGPKSRYKDGETILKAVKPWNTRIGLCADTGHFVRADVDPAKAIRMLKGRVHGVHLKDFTADDVDVRLGQGRMNVVDVLLALKEVAFTGHMALEYESDPKDPVPAMADSLAVVRTVLATW